MSVEMVSVVLRAPHRDMQHITVDGFTYKVNHDALVTVPPQHAPMARALGFVTPEEHAVSVETRRDQLKKELQALDELEETPLAEKPAPAPVPFAKSNK